MMHAFQFRSSEMEGKVIPNIPTVDLSVFFKDDGEGQKSAKETISRACADFGFFQVVNHGIPVDLMSRAMELSMEFFALPDEVKLLSGRKADAPAPNGYTKQHPLAADKSEFFMMLPPHSCTNVFPDNPPRFRSMLEELFACLSKRGELIESIINDCLGLPPNFLKEYNDDRRLDLMTTKHYFPATKPEEVVGITAHEDGNVMTLIIQDEVGGLEVLKDGNWISVVPSLGTLVVNLGDVIQVLTNKKLKSATHRVRRPQGRSRQSIVYFRNLEGEKWVEPLSQFSTEIGEQPKYRGFVYKDYIALRIRNRTHPPTRPQDEITISHYEI